MAKKWTLRHNVKIGLIISLLYTAGCLGMPTQAFSTTEVVVKGSTVNVRSAPGTANSIVTTVQSGQQFKVLDNRGDWFQIQVGNHSGWIAGWLVEAKSSDSAQPQQQNAVQKVKQATITGSVVNVRSGPGTSYSIVTAVEKGGMFNVTDVNGQWLKIKLNDGRQGWIAGWLASVKEVTAPNPAPAVSPAPTQQTQAGTQKIKQATITGSVVNVRSGPGTSYSIVTAVEKGGMFNVTDVNGQWLKIKLNDGRQGWIAGWLASVKEVTAPNPAPANPPPVNNNGTIVAVVNGSEVNIRGGPGTGHNVIGQVSRGQRVGVLERNGDWAKVQLEGGVIGWVAGWLLNVDTAEASPSPGDPPVQTPDTDQSEQPGTVEPVKLKRVQINELDGHTMVQLEAEGPLNYDMFMLTGPERLVLDLKNVDPADLPDKIRVDTEAVSQLRTGWLTQTPPTVRLVFDLKGTVANLDKLSDDRSQLSLDIFIPKPGSYLHGRVIALDPGHGGSDPGAIGPTGLREKDVTLDIALRLQKILTEHGAKVVMTRTDDSFVDLYERTAIAAQNNAEVFLSIHINANPSRDKNGTSTYYRRDTGDLAPGVNQADNRRLASLVQSEMMRALGRRSLGVLQANFVVLRTAPVPAALAEVAFISNYEEEQILRQDTVRQRVAESLAKALNSYFAPTM